MFDKVYNSMDQYIKSIQYLFLKIFELCNI